MYALHMPKERLQLLLEPRQRVALDRESTRTGRPIGELVRDAIDARFDADRERRLEAFERIRVGRVDIKLSPEEIERMIQSEHDWDRSETAELLRRRQRHRLRGIRRDDPSHGGSLEVMEADQQRGRRPAPRAPRSIEEVWHLELSGQLPGLEGQARDAHTTFCAHCSRSTTRSSTSRSASSSMATAFRAPTTASTPRPAFATGSRRSSAPTAASTRSSRLRRVDPIDRDALRGPLVMRSSGSARRRRRLRRPRRRLRTRSRPPRR